MSEQHWGQILNPLIQEAYHIDPQTKEKITLDKFIEDEYATQTIYPAKNQVLAAFYATKPQNIKVVILGQDPYINPGQAMGFAFAVPKQTPLPPSLKNIYNEIESDVGAKNDSNNCFADLSKQNVLLLNSILTVRAGQSKSHQSKPHAGQGWGWESVTDGVIQYLCNRKKPIVFMLWGESAKSKLTNIQIPSQHLILTTSHPSPYSAHQGFLGCQHFSKANKFLIQHYGEDINWQLP